jgi:uncharacterized membrane protein (TIGR01666 family)
MDYIREYKNFIHSYYLAAAVRVCLGALVPAIVMTSMGSLSIGILAALGATMASPADGPGPIHHRRNGMLISIAVIFFMAMATGFIAENILLLGIWIAISCFIGGMIAIYGERASAIGLSGLIVMTLTIGRVDTGSGFVMNALYMAAGATWYTILSLALHRLRPYRLPQQALGDCIISTANYLRIRTSFYDPNKDFDKVYEELMESQVEVHQQQTLLRELLFKSRDVIKESTNTSRTLVMIFVDSVDLFEKSTTSFYDYGLLRRHFANTGILEEFRLMITQMSEELDDIGLAVKVGVASREPIKMQQQLKHLQGRFDDFRKTQRKSGNIEAVITLRRVLNGIEDIANRIYTLHNYTRYDKTPERSKEDDSNLKSFVTSQSFSWKLIPANFTLDSNIFRHSLRLTIATIIGYLISVFFQLGHSYWILLTIIAILKPTFSLTTQRNYQRLIGTIAGALLGILLLVMFEDRTILFAWMLVLMIGAYSFLRTHYMVGVFFMTPYILIMFHLLNVADYQTILQDRLIDTAIACAIAFVASIILVPAWEQGQMKTHASKAIKDSMEYFRITSSSFTDKKISLLEYKLTRKSAYVSLANFSEAFSRMLDEPKIKQKDSKTIHQLVVMNHMIISHIAALSHLSTFAEKYRSYEFGAVINEILANLDAAIKIIDGGQVETKTADSTKRLMDKINEMLTVRKQEIGEGITQSETRVALMELKPIVDQFNFIAGLSRDFRTAVKSLS